MTDQAGPEGPVSIGYRNTYHESGENRLHPAQGRRPRVRVTRGDAGSGVDARPRSLHCGAPTERSAAVEE